MGSPMPVSRGFSVSKFNKYRMVDDKAVDDRVHEFQEYLEEAEKGGSGTIFSEDFKVSCFNR